MGDAVLGLVRTCWTYLCYDTFDHTHIDEEIRQNLLCGRYRFFNFAVSSWLPLVNTYLQSPDDKSKLGLLVPLLEDLMTDRYNYKFDLEIAEKKPEDKGLSFLLNQWPEAVTLLSSSIRFRKHSSQEDWTTTNGARWTFQP